ncbi:hypothetical protein CIPAW_13G175800 [Carya illinoinensis]|uniref:Uncharacterized protein n=1 Tax=Carya illinoinensis TaxID=32201 RepID=A0A8T1NTC8_CARIL|nr:hypothetical protein CIPAW_13G175800 [Carya illinoinensis]
MMLRTAVRSARGKLGQNMTPEGPGAHNPILSESEFTVHPAFMLRDRNILLPSTAVTPEIKGSTRAPVLRRGGRTDRGELLPEGYDHQNHQNTDNIDAQKPSNIWLVFVS